MNYFEQTKDNLGCPDGFPNGNYPTCQADLDNNCKKDCKKTICNNALGTFSYDNDGNATCYMSKNPCTKNYPYLGKSNKNICYNTRAMAKNPTGTCKDFCYIKDNPRCETGKPLKCSDDKNIEKNCLSTIHYKYPGKADGNREICYDTPERTGTCKNWCYINDKDNSACETGKSLKCSDDNKMDEKCKENIHYKFQGMGDSNRKQCYRTSNQAKISNGIHTKQPPCKDWCYVDEEVDCNDNIGNCSTHSTDTTAPPTHACSTSPTGRPLPCWADKIINSSCKENPPYIYQGQSDYNRANCYMNMQDAFTMGPKNNSNYDEVTCNNVNCGCKVYYQDSFNRQTLPGTVVAPLNTKDCDKWCWSGFGPETGCIGNVVYQAIVGQPIKKSSLATGPNKCAKQVPKPPDTPWPFPPVFRPSSNTPRCSQDHDTSDCGWTCTKDGYGNITGDTPYPPLGMPTVKPECCIDGGSVPCACP